MALGVLLIVYIVLFVLAAAAQFFMYQPKNESQNGIFIVNMVFGVVLAYLAYTSLATNYTELRYIAITFGAIAIIALVLKYIDQKYVIISKILLTASIVAGFIQLFL